MEKAMFTFEIKQYPVKFKFKARRSFHLIHTNCIKRLMKVLELLRCQLS